MTDMRSVSSLKSQLNNLIQRQQDYDALKVSQDSINGESNARYFS